MMRMDGGRMLFEQESSKPKRLGDTLSRFAQYFRRYWYMLLVVAGLILAAAWTQVTAPEIIGQAVDCYLFPQPQTLGECWYTTASMNMPTEDRLAGLTQLVIILLALYGGGAVLTGLGFYTMVWTGQHVLRHIRQDLFRHIHRLSLGYYSRNEAGEVMSRVTNDTDTIQQAFSFVLIQVANSVVIIAWVAIRMMQENLPYALLSLAVAPVMLFTTSFFSNQARRAFRRARRELGSVNADLQESIAGAREVQAFNREEETIAHFVEANAANRAANIRAAVFTSALNPVLEALGYVALGIVVLVGGYSVLRNEPLLGTNIITLGTVFAFLTYVQRIIQPISQIAVLWTNLQSAIAGGERVFSLMDTPVDITNKPNAQPLPPIQGEVVFEDVWAEYVAGEPVLRGISFKANKGDTIAIVGPTGAGKTTIINLLPRFYDVTNGAVKIDGHDVRDVTIDSLRSQIGLVLQDTFLFSTTVMENIRYGRLDATDDEVIAAAKLVAAHDFIERLPNGYQTILGERGAGLSQGQRQLIAIARVALMNPRILILDEATSSVDTRTERIIQAAFEKLLKGRTSFVIAHRLSTIRNATQVLMLKDGEIIERGTHRELLARQGAYYKLYMSQFQQQEAALVNGHSDLREVVPVLGE